ncbi:MAG: glutathione S-transferase N-terminal domain-containing protein [Nannocystaceae bacterium]|nr:glutathione S-transferase N-terminal domain-containing protein [Nannocystaceae bacterium]
MSGLRLVGRTSSHFTRVPRIVAHELGVPLTLIPLADLASTDPAAYGGNPALKVPTLLTPHGPVFGSEPASRTIAAWAAAPAQRLIWPEALHDPVARNAAELVAYGMQTQVQLVFATRVAGLDPAHPYLAKARIGLAGALDWLDERLETVLAMMPRGDDTAVSLLEITLFCLLEHLAFRPMLPWLPRPRLQRFVDAFALRPSAAATRYGVEPPP